MTQHIFFPTARLPHSKWFNNNKKRSERKKSGDWMMAWTIDSKQIVSKYILLIIIIIRPMSISSVFIKINVDIMMRMVWTSSSSSFPFRFDKNGFEQTIYMSRADEMGIFWFRFNQWSIFEFAEIERTSIFGGGGILACI